ncbi:MAG: protoporphyrinogen oxidase [Cytophagaceae bacterium]|jgi:oxygen-dependent protoporphyrinogen oxidase|nr:protoporphyrinogen oxidase [Cytophagaceae bacterium]
MKKAIIIGAGLSGLTTAYYLKKAGWEVTVLEQRERAGGLIRTHTQKTFVFESGPVSGVLNPDTIALFNNLKGELAWKHVKTPARRKLVWKNGQWHIFPTSLKSLLTTSLFTFSDKLRLAIESFRFKKIDMDVTVEESLKSRFGHSLWEYAVSPYISGTYAGDASRLITRYVYPDQHEFRHIYGSLVIGNFRSYRKKEKCFKHANIYDDFTVKGGFSNLVNVLVSKLNDKELLLNVQNVNVFPSGKEYSVHYEFAGSHFTETADVVVSTVGAYEVPGLLPFLRDDELNVISGLEYANVVLTVVGYSKWRGIPLKAYGGFVPVYDKSKILRILSPSLYFNNMTLKKGAAILYILLGGTQNPEVFEMNDEQIRDIVIEGMCHMMLTPSEEPDLLRIFRHNKVIPQYDASTSERLGVIENIQNQFPGLIIAGDLRDGFRISDRIKQGTQIAKRVIEANDF